MKTLRLFFIMIAAFSMSANVFAQNKHALLIGISDYGNETLEPNRWANINGANDIGLLSPILRNQGFTVTTLIDNKATYTAIIKALNKVATNSKANDLVYIHFSMHGQLIEDLDGDEDDGWDEALIPVDAKMIYQKGIYEGEKHLSDDMLEKYLDKIRLKIGEKGKLYVVLDACHSGTASRNDEDHVRGVRNGFSFSGKSHIPSITKDTNDYFSVSTKPGQSPITFLEACRSYQTNKEILDREKNIWYGSLSYYIAKSIQSCGIDFSGLWIDNVKAAMKTDRRLRRQNMVIESAQ